MMNNQIKNVNLNECIGFIDESIFTLNIRREKLWDLTSNSSLDQSSLYEIYLRKFKSHFEYVFSDKIKSLHKFLFCEECSNKIDQNDNCIGGHFSVYNNNLLTMSNDLQNLLSIVHNFYMFHKQFTNEYNNNCNIIKEEISTKLFVSTYLSSYKLYILKYIKLFTKIHLENFKYTLFNTLNKENSTSLSDDIFNKTKIKDDILSLLNELDLNNYLEVTIEELLKKEINKKISEYTNIFDRPVLREEIIVWFKKILLLWANKNMTTNANSLNIDNKFKMYETYFTEFIKTEYAISKIKVFFEIISNFPESQPCLNDLKECLNSKIQREIVSSLKEMFQSRLLTPGIATPLIIEIYIRIIKIMKFLDSTSYLLEMITEPIKIYLRQRKDSLRCIISTILSEEDAMIQEELAKQYIKIPLKILSKNMETKIKNSIDDDYDNISSDEDEIAAQNWEPLPCENFRNAFISYKSKISDIISTLVNIYGSQEKFIEQYKRMLSERFVTDFNFQLENEVNNLEKLKKRFGETCLHNCDIIIKDVKDSIKLKNTIQAKNNEFNLNTLIICKSFWPFKNNETFVYPDFIKKHIDEFVKDYSNIKFSRKLNFYTNLGYVDLTLSFPNGEYNFKVSQLSALIISLFNELKKEDSLTCEEISEKLHSNSSLVKRKLNFWVSKGVLNEVCVNDEARYFPSDSLKNLENMQKDKNLIIEDEIFNFEYETSGENNYNLENLISGIIKNSGPRTFEQIFKNLHFSYQINISENKLKDSLGKMILDQKLFKEGEIYKLIIPTN